MTDRPDDRIGGLAAVFAHPDDESFTAAGALALAHDAGRTVRPASWARASAPAAVKLSSSGCAKTAARPPIGSR